MSILLPIIYGMIELENISLLKIISQIHPVSEALQNDLIKTLAIETIPKKTYLLKEGEVFQKMYFIEKGLARAFYFDEQKEHTSWFMKEGDFIISVNSFYKQVPSQEHIEVLEDSIMASITYQQLQTLYQKHLEFNIISRVLTEHYYSLSEERLFAMRQSSAKHRFEFFINKYPELAKRISLKQMASFLRMTPETISRLRAEH
jgi:CRP-like cAMP-binding protein